MNLTLGLFTLLPLNFSMLSVIQPLHSEQAYIVIQFQNELSLFNLDNPKWPSQYERMELMQSKFYEKNVFTYQSSNLLKNQNKVFVRYQIRFFFKNRTYEDSKFVQHLWNDSLLRTNNNYYYTILLLCFSIIIITFIVLLLYFYHIKMK